MAAAEALGGPRSSQGSQYSWQRGLACVPGHTFSCTHKLTYPYSQRMRRDPRPLTHRLMYPFRHRLVLSAFQKHTCRRIREETHSEKYTDPRKIHHTCLLTPPVTGQTQHRLTPSRRRQAPKHTLTHRQTRLAATQRWTDPGDSLRRIGSTRAYAGADLVHKPTQTHYTQVLAPAEIHRPTPARQAQTPPITQTPPLCLPQRQQTADPGSLTRACTHGLTDTHSQETHVNRTWSHDIEAGHEHRAYRCQVCSIG